MTHASLFGKSDHALLADLRSLIATERAITVEVALHLAEVERRKLHKKLGYDDLYQYCIQELRMSEGAALRRIRAGRAARKYPAILAALEDGRLHMSAVVALAPHLRPDTVDELVAAATHKSRREIERMLGGRKARPRPRARVVDAFVVQEPQPVVIVPAGAPVEPPPPAAQAESAANATNSQQFSLTPASVTPEESAAKATHDPAAEPAPQEAKRAVEWLTMEIPMRRETHEQLERARELLSHVFPEGELADVLQRVLELALPELVRSKLANSGLPMAIAKQAWERANGHCEACGSRWQAELDHKQPKARGGQDTLENIQVLCRSCNQYKADVDYGAGGIGPLRSGGQ